MRVNMYHMYVISMYRYSIYTYIYTIQVHLKQQKEPALQFYVGGRKGS